MTSFRDTLIAFARKHGFIGILNLLSRAVSSLIKLGGKVFNYNPYDIIYSKRFYDEQEVIDKETNSSASVAEAVVKYLKPKSVIDVGCGTGNFIKKLQEQNIKCKGVEGSSIARKYAVIDKKDMIISDVTSPLNINRKFDLVMCIEVAEHIPTEKSRVLVDNLTSLGDNILFTAAKPGQGGTDHINEQNPRFWENLFNGNHFVLDKEKTTTMKRFLREKKCVFWIADNLLIFRKKK